MYIVFIIIENLLKVVFIVLLSVLFIYFYDFEVKLDEVAIHLTNYSSTFSGHCIHIYNWRVIFHLSLDYTLLNIYMLDSFCLSIKLTKNAYIYFN